MWPGFGHRPQSADPCLGRYNSVCSCGLWFQRRRSQGGSGSRPQRCRVAPHIPLERDIPSRHASLTVHPAKSLQLMVSLLSLGRDCPHPDPSSHTSRQCFGGRLPPPSAGLKGDCHRKGSGPMCPVREPSSPSTLTSGDSELATCLAPRREPAPRPAWALPGPEPLSPPWGEATGWGSGSSCSPSAYGMHLGTLGHTGPRASVDM